jgi:hypothetical protein
MAGELTDSRPRLFTRAAPVACMLLVALNDHVLKGAGLLPGVVTGKLSDFAGLYFAPLLLAELWMLAWPARASQVAVRRTVWAALFFGVLFTAIKTSPQADALYEAVLAFLSRHPARNTVDPTDLVALPMLALAVGDAWRVSVKPLAHRASASGV